MRHIVLLAVLLCGVSAFGAEEKIRGVLEKTAKPGACAQITDALSDIYYIAKTDESEKAVANYAGKNIKVVITGTVENREGDASYFFNLKSLEEYKPKMPPAPPAPAAPAVPATEKAPDAKANDEKK